MKYIFRQLLFFRHRYELNILSKQLSSIEYSTYKSCPVFIPTFNNPTYTSNLLKQIRSLQLDLNPIVFFDNNSTYAPMIKLLMDLELTPGCKVIRSKVNYGPRFLLQCYFIYLVLPDVFILTDPDLELSALVDRKFWAKFLELSEKYSVGKVGSALDIKDVDLMKKSYAIYEWESRFWQEVVGEAKDNTKIYKAPIDTTLALYNKKYYKPQNFFDAYRVDGIYTCKHLPWYENSTVPMDEVNYYNSKQKFSSTYMLLKNQQ